MRVIVLLFMLVLSAGEGVAAIVFPTPNEALLRGEPGEFFMYVERDFEGEKSKPWQGGQYGFVRGPKRLGDRIIYGRLHEGVDIRPVRRDPSGNPLDPIYAAADGKVVHVSDQPGASNYGKYIVIEHVEAGSPYYTLYAHLSTIGVQPGENVRAGQTIGRMGYTGRGIDRVRAHLHFEVCLRLSDRFQDWFDRHIKNSPNRHGEFNGMNLVGVEPSRLLLESRANPGISIADYIQRGEPEFRVAVPQTPGLFILRAYPWLREGRAQSARSWAITFSGYGVPLKAEPLDEATGKPTLVWARPGETAYSYRTRGLVTGEPGSPRLSSSGERFIELILGEPTDG